MSGNRILIVDDEPDIPGSLEELLDMCDLGTFLLDVMDAAEGRSGKKMRWFGRLDAFFYEKIGPDWCERECPEFWKKYFYT